MGYTHRSELGEPLVRKGQKGTKPYYLLQSFAFASFLYYYDMWYIRKDNKNVKVLPSSEFLFKYLTPFALAV
jgi:hypothetical protein